VHISTRKRLIARLGHQKEKETDNVILSVYDTHSII
jgi:hypothetical protein